MAKLSEDIYQRLLYRFSYVGCPACRYDANCDRPAECAENGCCLDLLKPENEMGQSVE
jgi:hypothetical protein